MLLGASGSRPEGYGMLSYRIDGDAGVVEITGEESSTEDFGRLLAAVLGDPAFQLGYGFLRDRRGAEVAEGLVRRRLDLVRHLRAIACGRWALIVDGDELTRYE